MKKSKSFRQIRHLSYLDTDISQPVDLFFNPRLIIRNHSNGFCENGCFLVESAKRSESRHQSRTKGKEWVDFSYKVEEADDLGDCIHNEQKERKETDLVTNDVFSFFFLCDLPRDKASNSSLKPCFRFLYWHRHLRRRQKGSLSISIREPCPNLSLKFSLFEIFDLSAVVGREGTGVDQGATRPWKDCFLPKWPMSTDRVFAVLNCQRMNDGRRDQVNSVKKFLCWNGTQRTEFPRFMPPAVPNMAFSMAASLASRSADRAVAWMRAISGE